MRLLAKAAVLCMALAASTAVANGGMFFDIQSSRPPLLRYVGQVKDTRGKPVDAFVVAITVKNIDLTFPFRNEGLGRFRSPDIGRAITGLGKPIDRAQIELAVIKRGYRTVSIQQRPVGTTIDVTIVVTPL